MATSTVSPSPMRSALRTLVLTGRTYPPLLGSSEVSHSVPPMRARTGIAPHPYDTAAASARTWAQPSSGTVNQ